MKQETLKAVYDDELVALMEALGIYTEFKRRELHCAFCKDRITWENLHSIFPDSGAVKCCCNRPECQQALIRRIEELKR